MSSITSTGMGSGLDITGLVSKLVEAEKTPQTKLLTQKADTLEAQVSALGSFKSAISTLNSSLSDLTDSSIFKGFKATSSNDSIVTASALSNADAGTYAVKVGQLAQSQSLATGTYDSADAVVGTGTLTIQFGSDPSSSGFKPNADQSALTLTIDSSNNTLTGIRDAINTANGGVTAALIHDGTGYRLTLTSTNSGVENAMRISVDSSDGLSALNYNDSTQTLSQTQVAQDAELTLNGLAITSSSNKVSSALKGVTLNLEQAQAGTTVKVAIQPDTDAITKALQGFVDAYNGLQSTVKTVAGYDTETKTAAALFGDSTINSVMSRLRTTLNASVTGLTGSIKTLTGLGITTQSDGTLSLNTTKLNKVLAETPQDVQGFLSVLGRTTNSGVAYVKSTTDTQAGEYGVHITQAATRGTLNGTMISGGSALTVDDTNNTLKISVDGISSGTISLTKGTTYTGDTLAAELQARINGDSQLKASGVSVAVAYDSDKDAFSFTSNTYGSTSKVALTEVGSGASTLGLHVANGTTGKDVEGTIGGTPSTHGSLVGGQVSDFTVDATNDTLQLTIDGISSGAITLTQGSSYTGASLAAELQTRINEDSQFTAAGVSVAVGYDSDTKKFTFTSNSYGPDSKVSITQVGSGAAALGLSVAAGTAGTDSADLITGKGQLLTASSGKAKGLQVLVTNTQTGDLGTVNFSRGKMDSLSSLLSSILDSKDGAIAAKSESLTKALEKNTTAQDDLDTRMNALEARLYVQFNAMDSIVATLQSTSDYLTQAFDAMTASNSNS